MDLNPFFITHFEAKVPNRVYARRIDGDGLAYVLFDAVDADWFDYENSPSQGLFTSDRWRSLATRAPIYAIEVNSRGGANPNALLWLKQWSRRLPQWLEIRIYEDENGPADLYGNINGPARPVRLFQDSIRPSVLQTLKKVTDLSPYVKAEDEITHALPAAKIDRIFVLDVGQGAANALVTTTNAIVAYVDLGTGVLADAGTWPAAMTGICLQNDPIIVLSHWHYDHFHAANKYKAALNRTWVAPFQKLGPGPQSAMANGIIQNGNLLVWSGLGRITQGAIELERCLGSSRDLNRSGIAVWVNGPSVGDDPILLPGDAGYADIKSLKGPPARLVTSLVISHHGGRAPGKPPPDPNLPTTRAAMSFGNNNSYTHPLSASVTKLQKAAWSIGFPNAKLDDRRTEDRAANGLGTIELRWQNSSTAPHMCNCGCSINPTQ